MSRAPDFVGLGAQGAGIAWWSGLLADHPEIALSDPPNRNFFEPFCARAMTDADVADYHAGFGGDGVRGEWSARYLYDFWTPPLLQRAAPDARLIALVRDPIERFRAGVAHQKRAVAQRKDQLATTDAVERGRYGEQVRQVLAWFAPQQLLVLQYERCVADPAAEYERTLRFLGVDPSHRPASLSAPPEEELAPEPWPDLRAGIVDVLAEDVAELASLVELDLSLWPDFA